MSTRMDDAVDKGRGGTIGDGSETLRTVPNRPMHIKKANPTEITLPGWLFFSPANLCCFRRLFVILIYDIVTDDRHGDHDITC